MPIPTKAIPENLIFLHGGEEEVRTKAIALVEGDADLSLHLGMIECVMDQLQFYRMDYSERTEDDLIVKLLGARIFNDIGAALKLMFGGYYQAAGLQIRDVLETGFLLDYFSTDTALIQKWKHVSEEKRTREFNLAKIREVLDTRDGLEGKKRYEHYKLLSSIAAHPTFAGFTMLRPEPTADAHMGPFLVPSLLTATLQELVKVCMIAWENFKWFFRPTTLTQYRAMLRYLETSYGWVERTYGKSVDRNDLEAIARIIKELERLQKA